MGVGGAELSPPRIAKKACSIVMHLYTSEGCVCVCVGGRGTLRRLTCKDLKICMREDGLSRVVSALQLKIYPTFSGMNTN